MVRGSRKIISSTIIAEIQKQKTSIFGKLTESWGLTPAEAAPNIERKAKREVFIVKVVCFFVLPDGNMSKSRHSLSPCSRKAYCGDIIAANSGLTLSRCISRDPRLKRFAWQTSTASGQRTERQSTEHNGTTDNGVVEDLEFLIPLVGIVGIVENVDSCCFPSPSPRGSLSQLDD